MCGSGFTRCTSETFTRACGSMVADLHAWMTDRDFLRKADCHIHKSTDLVMTEGLQRWLEAEGSKMRRGSGIVDYAHNTIDAVLPVHEREP